MGRGAVASGGGAPSGRRRADAVIAATAVTQNRRRDIGSDICVPETRNRGRELPMTCHLTHGCRHCRMQLQARRSAEEQNEIEGAGRERWGEGETTREAERERLAPRGRQ